MQKNSSIIEYQLIYKDGIIPPGFGDYLKTCFFLLQSLDLEFDMNFKNHSMSKFLVVENQQDTNYSIIENTK